MSFFFGFGSEVRLNKIMDQKNKWRKESFVSCDFTRAFGETEDEMVAVSNVFVWPERTNDKDAQCKKRKGGKEVSSFVRCLPACNHTIFLSLFFPVRFSRFSIVLKSSTYCCCCCSAAATQQRWIDDESYIKKWCFHLCTTALSQSIWKENATIGPFFFVWVLILFVSSRLVLFVFCVIPSHSVPILVIFQSSSPAAKQRDSRHMMATVFIINSSHDRPRRVYWILYRSGLFSIIFFWGAWFDSACADKKHLVNNETTIIGTRNQTDSEKTRATEGGMSVDIGSFILFLLLLLSNLYYCTLPRVHKMNW